MILIKDYAEDETKIKFIGEAANLQKIFVRLNLNRFVNLGLRKI